MPKKVLIITYYWPPAGGIAVQRWVKFSKYLSDFGWEPIIFTVSNGHYTLTDQSMLNEVPKNISVIKRPIWEPYHLYKFLVKEKKEGSQNPDEIKSGETISLVKKISVWVRSNIFIPDARRFWIKPSIKFLSKYLSENKIDAIVSTGPPHSAHLIALSLKKKKNIPWLADFRDPWTNMDYYRELILTKWADKKHHRLEKEVLTKADKVTVVGRGMKMEFEEKRGSQVTVVTNGFDENDFSNIKAEPDKYFSIVHMGSFFARINPIGLWEALSQLKKENDPLFKKLKIKLTGRVAPSVIESVKQFGLEEFLQLDSFQPHNEALRQMKSAALLLLCVFEETKFVVTGKLFEYLATQRPILYIGPVDGDAAQILSESQPENIFSKDQVPLIKKRVIELYDQFQANGANVSSESYKKYSHRQLSRQIAELLNEIPTSK
jgi:hypothetical protein